MKKLFFILLILPALACTILNQSSGASRPEPTAIQELAFMTLHVSPTPEVSTLCQVKTGIESGMLNLRDGPARSYQPFDVLHEGDLITLLDKPAENGWLFIEARSLQGWVNSNYVTCERRNKP